jgi:FixJ family two-component response regulator
VVAAQVVCIVDDDDSVRQALEGLVRSAGLQAAAFASGEEFLHSGLLPTTGCLILDLRMPGMDGLAVQERLTAKGHRTPIIILTAHGDEDNRARALAAGARVFLSKPFDADVLLDAVTKAMGYAGI